LICVIHIKKVTLASGLFQHGITIETNSVESTQANTGQVVDIILAAYVDKTS
jgi:hypothetical protein